LVRPVRGSFVPVARGLEVRGLGQKEAQPAPPSGHNPDMELLHRVVGPLATNVYVAADPATREAIAIDTAIPSLAFVTDALAERGWTLKLIVSSHGHWDHIGDNARVAEHTRAQIAVHPLDRERLEHPSRGLAPFEIPPSVPAVELAEGGVIRFGGLRLSVLHTPGHTEGSVCLLDADGGLLFSGDTLFANGWGRVDLPGGSAQQMADSITRLAGLEPHVRVLPGHGPSTTIGRERAWMDLVARSGQLIA
jgi:hydroxyacylglutathione hydrolase